MPSNGITLGRDVTLSIVDPNTSLNLLNVQITDFSAKPDAQLQKITNLEDTTHVVHHDGWSGSFGLIREGNNIDLYWAVIEAQYYAGANQLGGTITEVIQEADGSISEYLFTNVVIQLEDPGMYKANDIVNQKINFGASRRLKQ
jgi:hypothetical protein